MKFMVEGTPAQAFTDEITALFPAEMARGQELDAQGLRTAIYVAADFSRAWQIFTADALEDVRQALESLPLYQWTTYTITQLSDDQ